MRTMLLPDATILNRSILQRSSSIRGVGDSLDPEMQAAADFATNQATDQLNSAASSTTSASGGGFLSWLGSTISPVIQSVTPGLINQAAGVTRTNIQGQVAVQTAKTSNTMLWVGVIGLAGVFVFLQARKGGRRR